MWLVDEKLCHLWETVRHCVNCAMDELLFFLCSHEIFLLNEPTISIYKSNQLKLVVLNTFLNLFFWQILYFWQTVGMFVDQLVWECSVVKLVQSEASNLQTHFVLCLIDFPLLMSLVIRHILWLRLTNKIAIANAVSVDTDYRKDKIL